MKLLASFVAVFSITVLGVIGFLKPELLEIGAKNSKIDVAANSESASVGPRKPTSSSKSKRRRARTRVRTEEKEFDQFMSSFNSGSSRASRSGSRVSGPPPGLTQYPRPATPLKVSGWKNSMPLSLASLRGNVVVLKFWATWCGPCIRAIPHDNSLFRDYRNKGVAVIGVCTASGSEMMDKIAAEEKIYYPIVKDLDKRTANEYSVEVYPTYCVIDQSGNIRFPRCKKRDVEDAVNYLLSE